MKNYLSKSGDYGGERKFLVVYHCFQEGRSEMSILLEIHKIGKVRGQQEWGILAEKCLGGPIWEGYLG